MHAFRSLIRSVAWASLWGAGPAMAQVKLPPPSHDPRIERLFDALERVKTPRETALSPDGRLIAWNVYDEGIEVAPVSDPAAAHRLTACAEGERGDEFSVVFSPDSRRVAFLSDCGHGTSIEVADASGSSAPRQLTALRGEAKGLRWSADGRRLSFLYIEDGANPRTGPLAPRVMDDEGMAVQRIALVDTATGQLRPITPEHLHVYEFDWSPDGKRLAYVAAVPPGRENWWIAKLYVQHGDEKPQVILDPKTLTGPLRGRQIGLPRWCPDGRRIAFIGGLISDEGANGGDIYVVSPSGGAPKDLMPGWPETPVWYRWMDHERMQVTGIRSGFSHLYTFDLRSQTESPRDHVTLAAWIGSGGPDMSLSVARNGTMAMMRSSFTEPPEIWAGDGVHLRQVTHINDGAKPMWGRAESVRWENEGYPVQGWLLYPKDYDPAKKYPLMVWAHGGPSGMALSRWPGATYAAVPFSTMGYFVLMPNPRGSYGEGEKFASANYRDFGHGDFRDILAGVDAVEKRYPVDTSRVGLSGWSYGGFLTMFGVTQTHRFRAAMAGPGISDFLSYYGENAIGQWLIPFFGASVYDDPAIYARSSAIMYVKNIRTPMMLVVGDRDVICPEGQSMELWHALRELGVPTELVVYPGEGHGFSDAGHRRDVLERAMGWFAEYLR